LISRSPADIAWTWPMVGLEIGDASALHRPPQCFAHVHQMAFPVSGGEGQGQPGAATALILRITK
jgi:hypothetical protein